MKWKVIWKRQEFNNFMMFLSILCAIRLLHFYVCHSHDPILIHLLPYVSSIDAVDF